MCHIRPFLLLVSLFFLISFVQGFVIVEDKEDKEYQADQEFSPRHLNENVLDSESEEVEMEKLNRPGLVKISLIRSSLANGDQSLKHFLDQRQRYQQLSDSINRRFDEETRPNFFDKHVLKNDDSIIQERNIQNPNMFQRLFHRFSQALNRANSHEDQVEESNGMVDETTGMRMERLHHLLLVPRQILLAKQVHHAKFYNQDGQELADESGVEAVESEGGTVSPEGDTVSTEGDIVSTEGDTVSTEDVSSTPISKERDSGEDAEDSYSQTTIAWGEAFDPTEADDIEYNHRRNDDRVEGRRHSRSRHSRHHFGHHRDWSAKRENSLIVCSRDIVKFCTSSVIDAKSPSMMRACLLARESELSSECAAAVSHSTSIQCAADAVEFCPAETNATPMYSNIHHSWRGQKHKILRCLEKKPEQLSTKCLNALNDRRQRHGEEPISAGVDFNVPADVTTADNAAATPSPSPSPRFPRWALIATVGVIASLVFIGGLTVVLLIQHKRRRQRQAVLAAANSLNLPSPPTDVTAPHAIRVMEDQPYHRMDAVPTM